MLSPLHPPHAIHSSVGFAVVRPESIPRSDALTGELFLMPPPGIEPGTFGLRVRCSAS